MLVRQGHEADLYGSGRSPAVETLVLYVAGTPAGYVELEVQPDDNVEVAYFGLLPRFIGEGLGRYLL